MVKVKSVEFNYRQNAFRYHQVLFTVYTVYRYVYIHNIYMYVYYICNKNLKRVMNFRVTVQRRKFLGG